MARIARPLPTLLVVCIAACGGSPPPAAHPKTTAKPAHAESLAERQKASRIARLEAEPPSEPAPEAVVQVSLESLVTGVRPGGRFLLAAHFRIASGYRISWKNPGEVGKETVVSFRAPDGFDVGPVTFPVPEKYTVQGGFVGYGYEKETAVFVEVKAPSALSRSGVHRFDLSASWVACKKECATEHTDAFVELTTTYGNAAAKDVESGLAPFKARLPRPLSDVKDARQAWEGEGRTFVVSIPGAALRDFFPGEKPEPAPKKISMAGDVLRFAFGSAPGPEDKPLRGVVVAELDGRDAFFDVDAARRDSKHADPDGKPPKRARAAAPAPSPKRRHH